MYEKVENMYKVEHISLVLWEIHLNPVKDFCV